MNCSIKSIRQAVVVFAVCLLAGCASKPGIEGKWSGTAPFDSGGMAAVSYEFLPDGVVAMAATKSAATPSAKLKPGIAEMMFPGLADIASVHAVGKYSVKDDLLTITPKQVTLRDKKGQEPAFTPTLKKETQVNRFKIDGQTLTMDRLDGSKPVVLTRQNDGA